MIKTKMKPMPNVEIKLDILHPTNCVFWNNVIYDWNMNEIHLVNDNNCNIVNPIMVKGCYKEWQIMLGLHLVLSKTIRVGDTKHNV